MSRLKIFDAHCDVLYQLWENPNQKFQNSSILHITYEKLLQTGSKIQCFAIYIPEKVPNSERFNVALEMVDLFYNQVLAVSPKLKLVRTKEDVNRLKADEIGALLTLEGCDAIGSDLIKLKTLFRLGVSSVGLTWNHANAVADGSLESRGGGLSEFGKQVVAENNAAYAWTDVSHLSERGFWDCIDLSSYMIASHSNCYSLCKHPRNLKDEQIYALIKKDGMIGVTFVPEFLSLNKKATISDVLKHLDHICGLGGENNVGFGSDFDGITNTTFGLENYEGYELLASELLNYYTEAQVQKFLFTNFYNHLPL